MKQSVVVTVILATLVTGTAVLGAESAPSADLAQMEAQLAKLRLVYSDRHPEVVALLEKIQVQRRNEGLDAPRAPREPGDEDLQSARERLQKLRERYAEKHPEVIAQQKRIEELERQKAAGGR